MPPSATNRRIRKSPRRSGIARRPEPTRARSGPLGSPESGLSRSIMTIAGNSRRISSASSGYWAVYSDSGGRSPRRTRRANSSARRSNGLRSDVELSMVGPVARGPKAGPSLEETRHRREDVGEPLEGADVSIAGRGLLQAQDRGSLAVVELLEVPQHKDLAVDRVHRVEDILQAEPHLGPH